MLGGYGSVLDGQLVTKGTFGYNPNLKARPYDPGEGQGAARRSGLPQGLRHQDHHDVGTLSLRRRHRQCRRRHDDRVRREDHASTSSRARVWAQLDRSRELRPDSPGRLVQRRRRRLQYRLVHRGEQAQLLDQRRVRQALAEARSTMDEAERLQGLQPHDGDHARRGAVDLPRSACRASPAGRTRCPAGSRRAIRCCACTR